MGVAKYWLYFHASFICQPAGIMLVGFIVFFPGLLALVPIGYVAQYYCIDSPFVTLHGHCTLYADFAGTAHPLFVRAEIKIKRLFTGGRVEQNHFFVEF